MYRLQTMLSAYNSNPEEYWRNKVAAIYLVTTLSAKGSTARHGATQINTLVNISDFCTSHVFPELSNDSVDKLPLVKAECLKCLITFRSVLPRAPLEATLPHVAKVR